MTESHAFDTRLIEDAHGLICAFGLVPLASIGRDELEGSAADGPVWLHFNWADGRARDWLMDRARLLQEEIAGQLGETTNRNLYLLSIVTTAMLPITLVTGIFGMNVGGMPWLQNASGFSYVMVVMVLVVMISLALISRARVP
jgi:hypothetical protein